MSNPVPPIPGRYHRVLITGANGQLGRAFARALYHDSSHAKAHVANSPMFTWTDLQQPAGDASRPFITCNLANKEDILKLLDQVRPDLILNPGAYTAVDKAESEPELAHAVNADAVATMARWARDHDSTLIHYSTDYVFDGSGNTPRRETDKTAPISVYGRSKLAGEEAMQATGVRGAIFRTSWVYSDEGHNFIKTMLRLGTERDELRVVADQIGAPTSAHFLAKMTLVALARAATLDNAPLQNAAIYHLVPRGEISWHQFAEYILTHARNTGQPIKAQKIVPIATAEYPTPARRPLNSRLDCSKFARQFDVELPDWRAGVDQILEILCRPAS